MKKRIYITFGVVFFIWIIFFSVDYFRFNESHENSAGYFIDGYCPQFNVAIEVDEVYHHNKEKDDIRRKDIIDAIGCSFISLEV
jgi:very-short-patch-repair endonuclease